MKHHSLARPKRLLQLLIAFCAAALLATACGASTATVDLNSTAAPADASASDVVGDVAAPSDASENAAVADTTDSAVPEVAMDDTASFEFQATPEFLAMAAQQAEQTDSLRFEMFMEVEGGPAPMGSRTEPLMSGGQSGLASSVNMDISSMLGPLAEMGGFELSDMRMSIITSGTDMYLQAPFFSAMLSEIGGAAALGPEFEWIETIATDWGYIDLTKVNDMATVDGMMDMSGGMGWEDMLATLNEVGSVADGGEGEVRGVPTRIALANVTMAALAEAQGQDSSAALDDPMLDELADTPVELEVHIDADGLVRRIEYTIDAAAASQGDIGSIWQRIDMFDYGSAVAVEIPANAPDITEGFEALAGLGGF